MYDSKVLQKIETKYKINFLFETITYRKKKNENK